MVFQKKKEKKYIFKKKEINNCEVFLLYVDMLVCNTYQSLILDLTTFPGPATTELL